MHKFSAWTHLSNFDQSEHKIGRGAWSTRDYGEKSEKHLSFPPVFLNNWLNFRVWGHFEIKMLIVLGHSDINTKYFIRIFKKWACDHLKTSNLSADNFKKILHLDGSTPEPAIRLGDTGMRIPCFDSCQLITTLMCNQFSHGLPGLPKKLESVRVNIGIPVVRTDGLRAVYGHVITKISGMGRFTYPWCSAGALCARSSALKC